MGMLPDPISPEEAAAAMEDGEQVSGACCRCSGCFVVLC